jgi:hypothetical protein
LGGFSIFNRISLAVVGVLWAGFGLAAWLAPSVLVDTREWVDALPMAGKIIAWVVGLPWMIAVAVWQGGSSDLLKIGLVIALAVASVWTFYPRRIA